jgi:uncharacterized protein YtpQ (UPF0354 family)
MHVNVVSQSHQVREWNFSDHAFSFFSSGVIALIPILDLPFMTSLNGSLEPILLIARGDCLRKGALHYWQ